jgi:glycogen debranching enzyme
MDPHYVYAEKPSCDEDSRVLKQGETFAIFDHYGNIKRGGLGEEGLYHDGTRFLSRYFVRIGQTQAMILSSTTKKNNALLTVDLTNPDIGVGTDHFISRGSIHVFRNIFLWNDTLYERIRFKNYAQKPLETRFIIHFDSDFADIFEVRGTKRKERGSLLGQSVEGENITLAYRGLDHIVRKAIFSSVPPPVSVRPYEMEFSLSLQSREAKEFTFSVTCEIEPTHADRIPFEKAYRLAEDSFAKAIQSNSHVSTSHAQMNDWILRSEADIHMMQTETRWGLYPYAGVPWFSTPFGRDGIITALECLWFYPELAKGVLSYLSATQAERTNPERDAQPGKILHETRGGEMANLGEIPFGRYYGSVDATPLFVLLAGAYFERTGDLDFLIAIWPHVEQALKWIDTEGDPDHDGFVEYYRHSSTGLVHQGWKDSEDSVFLADGRLAKGPIALCEVQGYVFAGKRYAEKMALALGNIPLAEEFRKESELLRERFEKAFWCEDLGTYAMALDGDKVPCRVRSSNAGHCLFSGIASPEHATKLAKTLLSQDSFCGWGIRTVSSLEKRYNPMAYHNGSVWPHDNALIALGLSRYRIKAGVLKIFNGLFDASLFFSLHRMPELFCGFEKREGEGPTLYPVACSPQAWAAGSVFLLLEAALGLHIEVLPKQKVWLFNPVLPNFLNEIQIKGLHVGSATVDLLLRRHREDIGVNVLKRDGDLEIVVVK